MTTENKHPALEDLSVLYLLDRLTPTELSVASDTFQIKRASVGERLTDLDHDAAFAVYLIRGKLQLTELDTQNSIIIEDGTARANQPIAHLQASRHTLTCLSAVEYLCIPQFVLQNLVLRPAPGSVNPSTLSVTDRELRQDPLFEKGFEKGFEKLFAKIQDDLNEDRLVLPELPDVARRITTAILREQNVRQIAALVQSDPVITAMLFKVANSALYRQDKPIQRLDQAIVRIGLNTARNLVINFAMRAFFISEHPLINEKLRAVWQHSTEVAAIAYVMAKKLNGFDPDQALLMGLLHDIGTFPILKYLEGETNAQTSALQLDSIVAGLHGSLGGLILEKWGFDADFVAVARESDQWFRDSGAVAADYCDLILMAQLQSLMSRQVMADSFDMADLSLPLPNAVPAFTKLGLDELTPQTAALLLENAKQEIVQTMNLLAA